MRTAVAVRNDQAPTTVSIETTLLELVRVVSESTEDDAEVVSTIAHMLRSGSVKLCGCCKNEPVEDF